MDLPHPGKKHEPFDEEVVMKKTAIFLMVAFCLFLLIPPAFADDEIVVFKDDFDAMVNKNWKADNKLQVDFLPFAEPINGVLSAMLKPRLPVTPYGCHLESKKIEFLPGNYKIYMDVRGYSAVTNTKTGKVVIPSSKGVSTRVVLSNILTKEFLLPDVNRWKKYSFDFTVSKKTTSTIKFLFNSSLTLNDMKIVALQKINQVKFISDIVDEVVPGKKRGRVEVSKNRASFTVVFFGNIFRGGQDLQIRPTVDGKDSAYLTISKSGYIEDKDRKPGLSVTVATIPNPGAGTWEILVNKTSIPFAFHVNLPLIEMEKWGEKGGYMEVNNCYDYAADDMNRFKKTQKRVTGMPGASGKIKNPYKMMYVELPGGRFRAEMKLTKESLKAALLSDGFHEKKECMQKNHKDCWRVAFYINKAGENNDVIVQDDFHFVREDEKEPEWNSWPWESKWSQKCCENHKATDRRILGEKPNGGIWLGGPITDPSKDKVSYEDYIFCGYLYANHDIQTAYMDPLEMAIVELDDVIKRAPKNARALKERGIAYKCRPNMFPSYQPDTPQAAAFLRKEIEWLKHAVADWQQAVSLDSGLTTKLTKWIVKAHLELGGAYYRQKQNKHSIEEFSKAIKLDPLNSEAYRNRGMIFSIIGQYPKAIADLKKALDLGCENPKEVTEAIEAIKSRIRNP
jgi:tetratricopeptide (TPR) repeat protein